jgi:hypothetical protein
MWGMNLNANNVENVLVNSETETYQCGDVAKLNTNTLIILLLTIIPTCSGN